MCFGVVRLVKRLSLLEGQSFSFTFLVLLSLLLFCTFLTTLVLFIVFLSASSRCHFVFTPCILFYQ